MTTYKLSIQAAATHLHINLKSLSESIIVHLLPCMCSTACGIASHYRIYLLLLYPHCISHISQLCIQIYRICEDDVNVLIHSPFIAFHTVDQRFLNIEKGNTIQTYVTKSTSEAFRMILSVHSSDNSLFNWKTAVRTFGKSVLQMSSST